MKRSRRPPTQRSPCDHSHDWLHGGREKDGLFRPPPKPVCMNGAADRLLFQSPNPQDLSSCAQNRRKGGGFPGSYQPDEYVPGTSYGRILSYVAKENFP